MTPERHRDPAACYGARHERLNRFADWSGGEIMAAITANGLTLEYEVRGHGEPILFIMGLGGQLIDWPDDFIDLFVAAGYQTIRFDNRDIGLSSRTAVPTPARAQLTRALASPRPMQWDGYALADMADDAAGLLSALGLESAHVVGMSMGGMIAQELAIGHPDRVRTLCSIMSNTGDRRHGRVSVALAARLMRRSTPTLDTAVDDAVDTWRLFCGPHFDEATVRAMAEASVARSFDPDGVTRQAAAIAASPNRTKRLGGVTAPTLVIHGLADPLVLPSGGTATAKAIPESRLVCFPDMGHDLPRPRWDEMLEAIAANCNRA